MPPRLRAHLLLRGAARFVVVVAVAAVVGAVLGITLSELAGDDVASTPTEAPTTAAKAPPRSTGTTRSSDKPRVRVLSAVLQPAATASGRSRNRARLSVRVRVGNPSAKPLSWPTPTLRSGELRMRVDSNATDAAGPLLMPLTAGATVTGELRFETAGELTTRLSELRRARLRIADRTVPVRVTLGTPVESAAAR